MAISIAALQMQIMRSRGIPPSAVTFNPFTAIREAREREHEQTSLAALATSPTNTTTPRISPPTTTSSPPDLHQGTLPSTTIILPPPAEAKRPSVISNLLPPTTGSPASRERDTKMKDAPVANQEEGSDKPAESQPDCMDNLGADLSSDSELTSLETLSDEEITVCLDPDSVKFPTTFPQSSERYHQNPYNETYRSVQQPVDLLISCLQKGPKTIHFLAVAANIQYKEEMAQRALERHHEKILQPMPYITSMDEKNAKTAITMIDEDDLLFHDETQPGNLETSVKKLDENLRDEWDSIGGDVDSVPLGPIPLGVRLEPNPILKELDIPSFDLLAFLKRYPTYMRRQTVLFDHFCTSTTQHEYRQLYIHNLLSTRSALAQAATSVNTTFKQLDSLNNLPTIAKLIADRQNQIDDHTTYPQHSRLSVADPARFTSVATSAADSEAALRGRVSRNSHKSKSLIGSNDLGDYEGTKLDKLLGNKGPSAAEAQAVRELYYDMEQRMEDAFFWRELLKLEVRMSEAALARVECAASCTQVMVRMRASSSSGTAASGFPIGSGVKTKGKRKASEMSSSSFEDVDDEGRQHAEASLMRGQVDTMQLEAAQERWAMLGEVMRTCWGKVVGRLETQCKARKFSANETALCFRSLRARHAGELWDVVEQATAILYFTKVDDGYWTTGESEAAVKSRAPVVDPMKGKGKTRARKPRTVLN